MSDLGSFMESERNEAWRQQQDKQHHAERAHDKSIGAANELNATSVLDARETIKALMFINGGAAVAVLGFASTLIGRAGIDVGRVTALTNTLAWFIAGLCIGVFVFALAYFTNSAYAAALANKSHDWDHPYIHETTLSKRWRRFGRALHWSALFLSVVSLACFVIGTLSIRTDIANLTQASTPPAQVDKK